MSNYQLEYAAQNLGIQLKVLKYALSLIIAVLLAPVMHLLPYNNLKHLYSCVIGIILMWWVFEDDLIHSLISSSVTYLLIIFAPRDHKHIFVFFWTVGYLAYCHGYHCIFHYLSGVFDFRNTQMVLTIKLTSLAWNLYDGTSAKEISHKPSRDDNETKLHMIREKFAIHNIPTILEFFGYIYCFPTVMVGPALEFREYLDGIHNYAHNDKISDRSHLKRNSLPDPGINSPFSYWLLSALTPLMLGLLCLPMHLILSKHFPLSIVTDPLFISKYTVLYRYFYSIIAIYSIRFRFFFAWKIAEASAILAGFGYVSNNTSSTSSSNNSNGKCHKKDSTQHTTIIIPSNWRGAENVDILALESAITISSISKSWNKRTQTWLERYVYYRSERNILLTYFISSLWHGFYPGFYLFFFAIAIITRAERVLKQRLIQYYYNKQLPPPQCGTTSIIRGDSTERKHKHASFWKNGIFSISLSILKRLLLVPYYPLLSIFCFIRRFIIPLPFFSSTSSLRPVMRNNNEEMKLPFSYYEICWIWTFLLFNIYPPFFFLLSFEKCLLFIQSFYYLPIILLIILFFIPYIISSKLDNRKKTN